MLAFAAAVLSLFAVPASAQSSAVSIRIQGGCFAGSFVIPSWCPDPGPDVVGGLDREIELPLGVEADLFLENRFPWHSRGDAAGNTPDAWFVLVSESQFERCHREFSSPQEREECAANPAFGLSIRVPAGTDFRTRFLPAQAGTYRYYDHLHFSGYGVIRVRAR